MKVVRNSILFTVIASLGALAFAGSAWAGKKPAGDISKESAQGAVDHFVDGLNSLNADKALATIAAGDRMSLKGKDDVLGLISENKLINPKVKGVSSVREGSHVVGAKVAVTVEEVDPLDATRVPKNYVWYLVREGKDLKVSVLSVWLAKRDAED